MHVHLVYGDDWAGAYVNGELIMQNHSLCEIQLLNKVSKFGLPFKLDTSFNVDVEWLHKVGHLPKKIEDVVWKVEDDENQED